MSKPAYAIFGLIALAIVLGAFVRLDVEHGDTTSFVTFITSALVPGIPAIAGWMASRKAHSKASEANDTAQVAVNKADTAATAAVAAEHNTNGKLTEQFSQVRGDIASLAGHINTIDAKVTQHLADHGGGA